MITSGMMSSNTCEWATPQELFNLLDAEFHFTLDPCSTHENAKCEYHFTKEDDGLSQNWGGKEYSVILHMVKSFLSGLRSVMTSRALEPWLSC